MRTFFIIIFSFIITAGAVFFASGAAWLSYDSIKIKNAVEFNHKKHALLEEIDGCESCHKFNEDGGFTGLPAIGTCLACHNESYDAPEPAAKFTAVKKALAEYNENDKPWESYARQKKKVFFSHAIVMRGKSESGDPWMSCGFNVCHGRMSAAPDSYSGTINLKMKDCTGCHAALSISRRCMVCH